MELFGTVQSRADRSFFGTVSSHIDGIVCVKSCIQKCLVYIYYSVDLMVVIVVLPGVITIYIFWRCRSVSVLS